MRETFAPNQDLIRTHARKRVEDGAVTEGYRADRLQVIEVLNQVLATEIVCSLRYRHHYYMAHGIDAEAVVNEFLEHAAQELNHADMVARRIVQLGGAPDMNPETLAARSHSEYVASASLQEMIRENLIAERVAIETYSSLVRWLGNDDPTTRHMIEQILAEEEEHAEELARVISRT